MNLKKIIRENFRLIIFVIFVLVLTIYLFIETSGNQSSTPTIVTNELPVETEVLPENTEPTDNLVVDELVDEVIEDAPAIEENISLEDFVTGEEMIERRASVIAKDVDAIDGHIKIAESDQLALYLKEENLSIIVRNKNNGAIFYSTVENPEKSNENWSNFVKSSVVIEYLVDTNIVYSQADMYNGKPAIDVEKTETGFNAEIYYPDLEFGFTLSVELEEDNLLVEIPQASIIEESDKYKIGNVYVYPFLGYSKLDEEAGYLLIPDGSGATISLEDHLGQYKQPYSEMVYGANIGIDEPYVLSRVFNMVTSQKPNDIFAPIFGVIHEDKEAGFLGVIESGDWHAYIEAYPNGAILPYNWVTSKFVYRQFYNQSTSQTSGTMVVRQNKRNDFDIRLRYSFVEDETANLMGLAEAYRDYLLKAGLLPEITKAVDFQMRLDFLGAELEAGLIGHRLVAMTTFNQAHEILSDLVDAGLTNLLAIYRGWQADGESGSLGRNRFYVESALGGKGELLQLVEDFEQEIPIFFEDDPLRYNPFLNTEVGANIANKFNRRVHYEIVYGKVFRYFNYLEPLETVNRLSSKVESFPELENLALTGISNTVFSYSKKGTTYDRVSSASSYINSFSELVGNKSLLLDMPLQPYWQYAVGIYNLPMSSSGYVFEAEEVPFFAIALRGTLPLYATYSNFESNANEFFLKLVETGVNPSYLLTYEDSSLLKETNLSHIFSSNFSSYREEIIERYQELTELHHHISDSKIVAYRREDGISQVTFDNGVSIWVNFNDYSVMIEGQQIGAQSYKVVD